MNTNKKKRCKKCKKFFKPKYSSVQQACSHECAFSYAKTQREKDVKELNQARQNIANARNNKKQAQKLSHQIKLTTKVVHEYIHIRDRGKQCITCNSPLKEHFDAGHFYHGSKSNALRFDLDNIHGQCIQCNRRNHGMFQEYTSNLPKRIGEERFNALVSRYEDSLKTIHKWDPEELTSIRKKARKLTRELKKENTCLHPVEKVN